jgi:hypothetical protein
MTEVFFAFFAGSVRFCLLGILVDSLGDLPHWFYHTAILAVLTVIVGCV